MTTAVARVGEMHRPFGDADEVATRPCRGCGQPCSVTETGMAALRMGQKFLLDRGMMPMSEDAIFACERCEMKVRAAIGQANRDKADEMTAIIRDLKESSDPPSEREMLARLEELHHPDVPALLRAIGERKAERGASKGRKP